MVDISQYRKNYRDAYGGFLTLALYHTNSLLILVMVPFFFLVPGVGTGLSAGLLVLLSLATVPLYWRGGVKRWEWAFIVVVLFYFLVDFFDVYRDGSVSWLNTPARFLVFIPVLFYLRKFSFNPLSLWFTVIFGALTGAFVGCYEIFFEGLSRASSPNFRIISFGNMGFLLGILSYSYLISLVLRDDRRWRYIILSLVGILAGFIIILSSGSRGPVLSFVLSLAILPFFAGIKINPRSMLVLLSLPVLAAVLILNTNNSIKSRTLQELAILTEYKPLQGNQSSVGVRLDMLVIGWHKFTENPIVGSGKSSVRTYQAELVEDGRFVIAQRENYLHSDIVDRAAYSGILGLMSLFFLYMLPFYIIRKMDDVPVEQKLALICISLYVFFAGLTNISLYRPDIATYWALFNVILMGYRKKSLGISRD